MPFVCCNAFPPAWLSVLASSAKTHLFSLNRYGQFIFRKRASAVLLLNNSLLEFRYTPANGSLCCFLVSQYLCMKTKLKLLRLHLRHSSLAHQKYRYPNRIQSCSLPQGTRAALLICFIGSFTVPSSVFQHLNNHSVNILQVYPHLPVFSPRYLSCCAARGFSILPLMIGMFLPVFN